jgi:hypothetical protein
MEKYTLEVLELTTESERNTYKGYLEQVDAHNPFYKLELLDNPNKEQFQTKYFVFFVNGTPKILMNFFVRKIETAIAGGPYYDVISPYGYCGPLFSNHIESETIINFWSTVDQWYLVNNMVSEFIRFGLNKNHLYYSGSSIKTLNNICGQIVDEKEQWNNFKPKVRNNYRKAVQENLRHEMLYLNITPEKIKAFYDIYISTMSRNIAEEYYHYNFEYFINFIAANPTSCALLMVYKENVAISTELILLNKDTMYSFLGGTLSDYFYTRPNDYLKIQAIDWGRSQGYTYYVLGGGRVDNDGLYNYKKTFFPKDPVLEYYTGRKTINHNIYQKLCEEAHLDKGDATVHLQNLANGFFPKYRQAQQKGASIDLQTITDPGEWRNCLKEFNIYDFYHTYDYHQLSKKADEKAVLIQYKNNGTTIAMPLLLRAIPNTNFYDATSVYGYAGPLTNNPTADLDNSYFKEALAAYCEQHKIISIFSRLNPYIPRQEMVLRNMGHIETLGNVVNMDIKQTLEISRSNYSKSTKSRVNKARKQCYTKFAETEEEICAFVDIYHENMNRLEAGSEYYFDYNYFLEFFKSKDFETDIILVHHNETHEAIAGSMFVKTNGIVQFHLSGTKNDFLHIAPARVFLDEMRILATEQKQHYFNLGGGLGGNEDSLFEFKSSFSKDFKPFKLWKFIVDQKAYDQLCRSLDALKLEQNPNFFPLYRL